jgi:hypothetical protein
LKKLYQLGLMLILVGCHSSPSPASSGVEGQVFIGPMCPMMQVGNPCPDRPFQASLTIFHSTGERVSSVKTGVDGSFRLSLAPGKYILRPELSGGMSHAPEQIFSVLINQYTKLTVTYDSGIR